MNWLNKNEFSEVFRVGEVIPSGAGRRKNAARLKILAIEDDLVRYQSIGSASKSRMRYRYLQILIDSFKDIKPESIEKGVNEALKKKGFMSDYSTTTYVYSFAKAYHERTNPAKPESTGHLEGKRVLLRLKRPERSDRARRECIQYHGAWCHACDTDFEKIHGEIGQIIHVHHHREKLSAAKGEYRVNPVKDLIPLCPNCHAMIHKPKSMLTVKELRRRLASARSH